MPGRTSSDIFAGIVSWTSQLLTQLQAPRPGLLMVEPLCEILVPLTGVIYQRLPHGLQVLTPFALGEWSTECLAIAHSSRQCRELVAYTPELLEEVWSSGGRISANLCASQWPSNITSYDCSEKHIKTKPWQCLKLQQAPQSHSPNRTYSLRQHHEVLNHHLYRHEQVRCHL